ncbi:hypothetical protein [Flavobacterium sp. 3HN19-14]|uniref:hypothetical protein n=1 Tax=Flavobacterium sp. 3HN19-14 TaxID=3448133 RepID=UPI003EDFE778
MKSLFRFSLLIFFLFVAAPHTIAQETSKADPDIDLKLELYKKYKKRYWPLPKRISMRFFFDFFSKMDEGQPALTKEEYYTYTIKIAIYNERLGRLYKDKKKFLLNQKKNGSAKITRFT